MRINRRIRFIVKWAPLLLTAGLVWLFFSLRQSQFSIAYLIACAGIGLLCGGLIILDFRKESNLLFTLGIMIFIAGDNILRMLFFPDGGNSSFRNTSSQYLSIVLVSVLGVVVVLRQRIVRYVSQADVEQALAAERNQRVSNR